MRLIRPRYEIVSITDNPLQVIEHAARVAYQSWDRSLPTSALPFVESLLRKGHLTPFEFADMTVRFIVSRGIANELTRHRLCSFVQESSRYCKYDDVFTLIIPEWIPELPEGLYMSVMQEGIPTTGSAFDWCASMLYAENNYRNILIQGESPQNAREVLPLSTKTEVLMKANFREWMHIFTLRTGKPAHPGMRDIMSRLLKEVRDKVPVVFDSLEN